MLPPMTASLMSMPDTIAVAIEWMPMRMPLESQTTVPMS